MDSTTAARVFMGDSLGFHIIIVLFSLGLPVLVSWFEWLGIRRRDATFTRLAKKWSKIMTILVVSGVISGTIIALQMSLVWPGILQFGGKVIGLPFMFETYAFLVEAVFLALYMATWNNKRVSPKAHWLLGLMVIAAGSATAFFITSVNAWMNNPVGFEMVGDQLTNINVWKPLFSVTSLIEFFHSMPGYFLACTLSVAGVYAWPILRSTPKDRMSQKFMVNRMVVKKLLSFSAILLLATAVMGHFSAVYLAKHEPLKLAALESHKQTSAKAPTIIGGIPDAEGNLQGPHIKIPNALSILAGNSPNTVVKGLEEFPRDIWPPLIIHVLFDVKLALVGLITIILILYIISEILKKRWHLNTAVLAGVVMSGLLAVIVIELGWMLTEIGRQPWAVRGYLLTKQAVTQTNDVTSFGYIFPLSFVGLFAVTIGAIKIVAKQEEKA